MLVGFEKPSAIQQRAILPIIKGRDVIAQSQSGTGKTGVFCIGVLQNIDPSLMETQALILSPTRELAEQSQKVLLSIGDCMKVQCHACVGGKSLSDDIRRLDYGVQVVSGTPGRVYDMINRRHLRTRNIKILVIDEANQLLEPPSLSAKTKNMEYLRLNLWEKTRTPVALIFTTYSLGEFEHGRLSAFLEQFLGRAMNRCDIPAGVFSVSD